MQSEAIRQRYANKAADFRAQNPAYQGSTSLLSAKQIERAQGLIRHDGQQIANNIAHQQASAQLQQEFDLLRKQASPIDTLMGDNWLASFAQGPSKPLQSDIAAYQMYSSGLTNLSAGVGSLGMASSSLSFMLGNGWGSSLGLGKEWNIFWDNPQLSSHADWRFGAPALNEFGKKLGVGGILLSGAGAVNEIYNNPLGADSVDYAREWGKFGLDTLAAATGILPQLARFNSLGTIYSGLDIAVQLTPGYTVRYGSEAGTVKTGWTKFLYVQSDQAEYMYQKDPHMYYQLYIKRDPKF